MSTRAPDGPVTRNRLPRIDGQHDARFVLRRDANERPPHSTARTEDRDGDYESASYAARSAFPGAVTERHHRFAEHVLA